MSYGSGEIIAIVQRELGDLNDNLVEQDYLDAALTTESETGWSFPVSSGFRFFWSKDRIKRHAIFKLVNSYALKFRYKNAYLNQRWEHLQKMVEKMDEEFIRIQEEQYDEFVPGIEGFHAFGSVIGTGFAYDGLGRDRTYEDSTDVFVYPGDEE